MKNHAVISTKLKRLLWGACGIILLFPLTADAHLVSTGLGPIYDGISHVLLSMDDLLPILAMALLAGLNGPVAGRRTLFALSVSWLAGGLFGYWSGLNFLPGAIVCVSFLVLGGLTAADRRLSPNLVMALAVCLGVSHGWLNGVAISQAKLDILGLAGITATIFVLVALVSAGVVSIRINWMRIVVRVAGSWVFASGLLLAGWMLKGKA
ncbi:MAG: HupE/UreJ family protein [Desulfobacterales bacterium]